MKKIVTLILCIIMIAAFGITVFAENDSVDSVPETDNSSSDISSGDQNNSSSESSSSDSQSSDSQPSSSESDSSSEDTTSSTPTDNTVKTTLQIVELPKKTAYELGETLDLTGLKVNIISGDGAVVSLDGKDLSVSQTVLNTEGEQRIQIKYNDAVAYFNVTVNPKHIHKYGAWKIEKEATCDSVGSKVRECECKHNEIQVIEKLQHDWDEGKIIKKATQKTEGVIRYVCTRCGKSNDEVLPIIDNNEQVQSNTEKSFKLQLEWWMIFVPVAVIIAGYITAISIIFKKKA